LAIDDKELEWEFDQNAKKETDVDYMTKAFNLLNSALKENRVVSAKVVDIQENVKNIQPPEPLNTS
jgi:DNA topoisomerase IA